jgi:hypothetical protein
MSKVKHYFATHPDSPECFETANGYLFHKRSDADAHTQILQNRTVKHHKRADQMEAAPAPVEANQSEETPTTEETPAGKKRTTSPKSKE